MDFEPVREAYASMSERYIALVDGVTREAEADRPFIEEHLAGLAGPVLDLGCGPGQWSAHLHALGLDVTGIDLVPEFVDHAEATYKGPTFRLGSMTEPGAPPHSVAGILAWYSTIHLPPAELEPVLAGFHGLLVPGGVLVIGFFDSDDGVARFDHAVTPAYRWPADVFSARLAQAGFTELNRGRPYPDRPERKYAAIAARAS